MKTIKDIKLALDAELSWQNWMEELEADSRDGVKKALATWKNKLAKRLKIQEDHREKLQFDQSFRVHEGAFIAGTDEAGRGPLAGPVVTAAVILPVECPELEGLNDSKQLSSEKREEFMKLVEKHALASTIHFQHEEAIDELNIYEATRQSMKASIENLQITPDFVLADAMTLDIEIPQQSIIKGDAKSLAIAAASILAKTARDHYMVKMDEKYPGYGFAKHAGYGTKEHVEAIHTLGVTPIHRKTFEPIKSILKKE